MCGNFVTPSQSFRLIKRISLDFFPFHSYIYATREGDAYWTHHGRANDDGKAHIKGQFTLEIYYFLQV